MRNVALGLSALMTLAAIVPLTVADHDVFSDEYADGTQDWGARGTAEWDVIPGQLGGVLLGLNNVTNATDSVAFAGLKTWEDYRYKVEVMRISNSTLNPWVGVTWRLDDFKGYYLLALRDGEYYFGAPDLAGGQTTLQAFTALTWLDVDLWNEVKIITDGDDHSFYLNGDHIQTITDATSGKGKIGVALAPLAEAVFDNAHVVTLVDRVDTLPPIVDITSPDGSAVVDSLLGQAVIIGGTLDLEVDAADATEGGNESGIKSVRVYLDGDAVSFQSGHMASTYTFSIDVSEAGLGGHTISVYGEDFAHHRSFDTLDIFVVSTCEGFGPGIRMCVP